MILRCGQGRAARTWRASVGRSPRASQRGVGHARRSRAHALTPATGPPLLVPRSCRGFSRSRSRSRRLLGRLRMHALVLLLLCSGGAAAPLLQRPSAPQDSSGEAPRSSMLEGERRIAGMQARRDDSVPSASSSPSGIRPLHASSGAVARSDWRRSPVRQKVRDVAMSVKQVRHRRPRPHSSPTLVWALSHPHAPSPPLAPRPRHDTRLRLRHGTRVRP